MATPETSGGLDAGWSPPMIAAEKAIEMSVEPIREVRRITVTAVDTREGLGAFGSPVHIVTSYFLDDGTLIGRTGVWEQEAPGA